MTQDPTRWSVNIDQPRRLRTAKAGPSIGEMRRDRRYGMPRARGRTTRPRCGVRVSVAVGCALTIAACGSATVAQHPMGSGASWQGVRYADCMRSEGVPNFPDPGAGGGGGIPVSAGINPQSPVFKSASQACAKVLPAAVSGMHSTEQQKLQALRTAECMRQHGVSGFLDPMTSRPSKLAAYSELQNNGGLITAIPNTIDPSSPAFERAAAICGLSR